MRTAVVTLMLALLCLGVAAGAQGSDPARDATARGGEKQARAAARKKKRTKCQRLRGRDLAPARNVKLVRKKTQDGNNLVGCVLPRGKVYKVASYEDLYTTVYSYDLVQVAGAIVLVDESYSSQYGASSSTGVMNLRTGRSYGIASTCATIGSPGPCNTTDAVARRAFINRRGEAAAAVVRSLGDLTTIAAFSSKGVRRELDSGPSSQVPASSLKLAGNTVSWTHSGGARSAPLGP